MTSDIFKLLTKFKDLSSDKFWLEAKKFQIILVCLPRLVEKIEVSFPLLPIHECATVDLLNNLLLALPHNYLLVILYIYLPQFHSFLVPINVPTFRVKKSFRKVFLKTFLIILNAITWDSRFDQL